MPARAVLSDDLLARAWHGSGHNPRGFISDPYQSYGP
jgi:hypothetical protein